MGAFDDFSKAISDTDVVQRVIQSMMIEAAQVLRDISRSYEDTGEPMGDHHLPAGGYMGEMVVKALLEAGQIEEISAEGSGALHQYKPTKQGQSAYGKLKKADAFARKAS